MDPSAPPEYQARIVPALHRIQARCGYLRRDELERFAREAQVPLHRLQSVASFFPHFRLTPPPKLTLKVCRDMACHLGGSDSLRKEIREIAGDRVAVEGVSCLGRCDRAPAACMAVQPGPSSRVAGANGDGAREADQPNEFYYLGCAPERLKQIVQEFLAGRTPRPNLDGDQPYWSGDWHIDPYKGLKPTFAAAKKAVTGVGAPS